MIHISNSDKNHLFFRPVAKMIAAKKRPQRGRRSKKTDK
jgi:hypothetical protein